MPYDNPSSGFDETQLLGILRAERTASVGFDYDETLNADRERALNYYKGDVSQDMPTLPNRSSVVSTDVADGVERALPDLIEIFASGDDGIVFQAFGAEDEDQAKQETDYVRHVIFQQNKGFRVLYTAFKDALLSKVGVFKFWWDGQEEFQEYTTEIPLDNAESLMADDATVEMLLADLENMGNEIVDTEPDEARGVLKVTLRKMVSAGQVRIKAVAPEDFTVTDDTVDLCDTTYCAYRSRARIQELLDDGYDPDKVAQLTDDNSSASEMVELARDTVQENSEGEVHGAAIDALRTVEITEHYIRLDLEGTGRPQIWRIVTGNHEAVILDMEKRSRIEFAAVTPYPMTHRFYGQSLADKLIEIQKWKTSLVRMLNDSGYFAINQRVTVNVAKATADTIPALLDNQPGRPVPVNGEGAIDPIKASAPSFDMLGALEYANTVAEERTGVVRNAQGLNPDTLHDTAKGAQILIGAAQKRLRMMARLFAETGIRDLFLGVHDLLRSNATMQDTIRLRNNWVPVSPNEWQRRKDVVIEIGVGSGGREEEIMKFNMLADRITQIIEMQQGPQEGGIVTSQNLYNAIDAFADRLGIKGVERFISDPSQASQQEQEGPSPEEQEIATKARLEKFKAQLQAETERMKAQAKSDVEAFKAQQKAILDRQKADFEAELARDKARFQAYLAERQAESKSLPHNRPGGDLDK